MSPPLSLMEASLVLTVVLCSGGDLAIPAAWLLSSLFSAFVVPGSWERCLIGFRVASLHVIVAG